jgi:hypothetical protein
MVEFQRWSHATPNPDSPSISDILQNIPKGEVARDIESRVPNSIETKEEAMALRWALDYHIPLSIVRENDYPWILVPYERLVTSGEAEVRRIFEFIGEPPHPRRSST